MKIICELNEFLLLNSMQVKVDIGCDQLMSIFRTLPKRQLKQLKAIEQESKKKESMIDLETLLLHGPVATDKQLEIIAQNRKNLNQYKRQRLN